MSLKPKSLIPDAMVVIVLHELGIWDSFCQHVTVVVPSIIVHECQFYIDPAAGEREEIHLDEQVRAGKILEATATFDQMAEFGARFDALMLSELHGGEVEALTLLLLDRVSDCWLCTADRAAVKALVMVGLKERGISLEEALQVLGVHRPRRLEEQYTKVSFERWIREAAQDRIQGRGPASRQL